MGMEHDSKSNIRYLYPGYENLKSDQNESNHEVDPFNTDAYNDLSEPEQRCYREGLMWGSITDINIIFNRDEWEAYFDLYTVGLHEGGHALEGEASSLNVSGIEVYRPGGSLRGVTKFSGTIDPFDSQSLGRFGRTAFAGGAAVEAEGLKAHGCGSDHGKARSVARRISVLTGHSADSIETGMKSEARSNANWRRFQVRHLAHKLARAA